MQTKWSRYHTLPDFLSHSFYFVLFTVFCSYLPRHHQVRNYFNIYLQAICTLISFELQCPKYGNVCRVYREDHWIIIIISSPKYGNACRVFLDDQWIRISPKYGNVCRVYLDDHLIRISPKYNTDDHDIDH